MPRIPGRKPMTRFLKLLWFVGLSYVVFLILKYWLRI